MIEVKAKLPDGMVLTKRVEGKSMIHYHREFGLIAIYDQDAKTTLYVSPENVSFIEED